MELVLTREISNGRMRTMDVNKIKTRCELTTIDAVPMVAAFLRRSSSSEEARFVSLYFLPWWLLSNSSSFFFDPFVFLFEIKVENEPTEAAALARVNRFRQFESFMFWKVSLIKACFQCRTTPKKRKAERDMAGRRGRKGLFRIHQDVII